MQYPARPRGASPREAQEEVGVVLSHEDWITRFGKGDDGLGPEDWGDERWVGVWFPHSDQMVGQHGDLDRAGLGFWEEAEATDAVRALVRCLTGKACRGAGSVRVTVRPDVAIVMNFNNREG